MREGPLPEDLGRPNVRANVRINVRSWPDPVLHSRIAKKLRVLVGLINPSSSGTTAAYPSANE
jgi:hypothetical protein